MHYSRTSVARTLMDHLPRRFRTRSRVPNKRHPIVADIMVFRIISDGFLFILIMVCVFTH